MQGDVTQEQVVRSENENIFSHGLRETFSFFSFIERNIVLSCRQLSDNQKGKAGGKTVERHVPVCT